MVVAGADWLTAVVVVFSALKLSTLRQPRYNSSRTRSSSHYVTATDGASVCARVCGMIPAVLENRDEQTFSTSCEIIGGGQQTTTTPPQYTRRRQ